MPAILLLFACMLTLPVTLPARDTLVVQTFTYDSIHARRASFLFPTADRSWEKVLMRYAIKCDEATPGDAFPCGEWDVTTHTRLFRHTGIMDSTRTEQAWFSAGGEEPQELGIRHSATWNQRLDWSGHRPAEGQYLRFSGQDAVQLHAGTLATVDSSFSMAFWLRGDPELQPQSDQLFEASAGGARVINLHCPWSSMDVIFDAGGHAEGNNNRIQKQASAGQVSGLWNHWVFTKDARSGRMAIWLNGLLWHEAGNMGRSMEGIDRAVLGANSGVNGGWYAGDLDDFALWSRELAAADVSRLIEAGPAALPESLLLYWDFEDVEAGLVMDCSEHGHAGELQGEPELRPHGWLGRSDGLPAPGATLVLDSLRAPALSLYFHEDSLNLERVTRRERVWAARRELFDPFGRSIQQEELEPDTVLVQHRIVSWSEAFERIVEIELGRYITPYGKGLDLGEEGFVHWRELTEFASLLEGPVELEAHNGFELIDLRFLFIEGEPAREILSIDPVWPLAGHRYDRIAADEVLSPVLMPIHPSAHGAFLLSTISGHGHAGPRHCCEWDPKEHWLSLGGRPGPSWTVWRDCGLNPIHPQGGTWQFDRAGWCPGTFVDTYRHDLGPWLHPGEELLIEYSIEQPDPRNGEDQGYFIHSHLLVQTGPPRFARDLELVDILSPGLKDECRRYSPSTHEVLLRVRNRGSDPLRSCEIRYGLSGGTMEQQTWQGDLAFMETDTLRLPAPSWRGWSPGSLFVAELRRPNGARDEYSANNRAEVALPAPLVLPDTMIVEVKSPGFGRAAENRWWIEDQLGRVVAKRDTLFDDSLHRDRVVLQPGAWHFRLEDSEQDGMIRHWWLRGVAPEKVGENGSVKLLDTKGTELLNLGFDFAERTEAWFFVGEAR